MKLWMALVALGAAALAALATLGVPGRNCGQANLTKERVMETRATARKIETVRKTEKATFAAG